MKTVVITGVSRGIGKALSGVFAKEGYRVIGTAISPESVAGMETLPLDLRREDSIEQCAEEIRRRGPVDILINNAGVLLDEEETDVVPEKLRATLDVNLIGTAAFTERIIPSVSSGGHIVNISSAAGSLSLPAKHDHSPGHYPSYKISKTALNMYTRTLSGRLAEKGIIVSSVHPGWVRTDMGGEEATISVEEAARDIFNLAVSPVETGQFWFKGEKLPW